MATLQIPIEDFPTLTEKWVDVDLSHQRVTAYEGTCLVGSFLISSGKSPTPTVRRRLPYLGQNFLTNHGGRQYRRR